MDESKPPTTLDRVAIHALSNQLAVIFGLVELILAETGPDDSRHGDLVEIREAAINAARLIGRPLTDPDSPE